MATFYTIDPSWYEERAVSLARVVRERRCLECHAAGFPQLGKRKGGSRRRAAAPSAPSWEEEMASIGRDCASKVGFIASNTPLVEAVFRLLLQHGNRPTSVTQLTEEVKERWTGLEYWRELSVATLGRLLEHQTTCGLRAVSGAELEALTAR